MYPAVAYVSLGDIVLLDTIKLKIQHPKVVNMAVDAYCLVQLLIRQSLVVYLVAHSSFSPLINYCNRLGLSIYFSFSTPASFFVFFVSNRPLSSDLIGFYVNNLVEDQL